MGAEHERIGRRRASGTIVVEMRPSPGQYVLVMLIATAVAGCKQPAPDIGQAGQTRAPGSATRSLPAGIRPFRMGTPDIVLLVTGCTNGVLETCNCTRIMPGGLARRSGLASSYRSAFPNVFLLDTGDALWIEQPDDPRNEYLLRGYRQIGYDALVLADQEWSIPLPLLRRWMSAGRMAYLSTTVRPDADARLPLTDVVTREWGDVKLAVLSDIRRDALQFMGGKKLEGLAFSPPEKLTERVAALKRAGYVVVISPHGVDLQLEATAKSCDADLLLPGHIGITELQLRSVSGKPAARVGGSGHVGVFAMKVSGGRIADLEYRAELVDRRWPGDRELIRTYEAYTHVAMRRALDAKRKKGLAYMPSAQCGKCHQPQYEAWQKSAHAHAWRTLVKAKRTGDPNCLMCHTSGFGTEKGFYTIDKTPKLANVNCQDCHRFNDPEHRAKGFRAAPIGKKLCTSCHTRTTDPSFDYTARLMKIACPHGPPSAPHAQGSKVEAAGKPEGSSG